MEYERIDPIWDSGNYIFMEGVTDESCKNAMRFIAYHNMKQSPLDKLTIIINSPGGSLTACFALMDMMRTSSIPVHTLVLGQVCSCGILITMAGAKRVMSEMATAMSHTYSWGAGGKHGDLVNSRKAQDMSKELIVKHYMKCTKKSRKFVEKNLVPDHGDIWLSPEECLEYGIIDEIKKIP